jgi:hypothetical protein
MAHPQPDPAHVARRLSAVADSVWTATVDTPVTDPQLILLEAVWTALTRLAAEMDEAATPCDIPECPGRHDTWIRAHTCADPQPSSPYNAPCDRATGHDGLHGNGFSEWADPLADTDDGRYLVVGADGTRLTVAGIDSARIVAKSFAGSVAPL